MTAAADRHNITTVQLYPEGADVWAVKSGFCSCPMRSDCKHVAAIVIAAAGVTKAPAEPAPPAPPAWRRSLDALLRAVPEHLRLGF